LSALNEWTGSVQPDRIDFEEMLALAANLFLEIRPDFFRVLAGPLARLYVDTLDALEREATRRNQGLEREEALSVVEQMVEEYSKLEIVTPEAFFAIIIATVITVFLTLYEHQGAGGQ
jgi:hypothetical protein